jgi:hypothetical protein
LRHVRETNPEGVVIEKIGGTGTRLVGRLSFNGRIIVLCRVFLAASLLAGLAGCGGAAAPAPARPNVPTGALECGDHMKTYDAARKGEAWAAIREYSPEGAFMIGEVGKITEEICGHRSEDFVKFVKDGEKDMEYYITVATSIHEMAHDFSSWAMTRVARWHEPQNGWVWVTDKSPYGSDAFYLPGKGVVYVPRTETFSAQKIAPRVPEELRDSTYRAYITTPHLSHVTGVYGLLDEFHAYYHDHQAMERMLRSELRLFVPGDHLRFLKFKYYILEYLDYARKREKAIFKGIMANRDFVETFLDIHDRFEALHLANLEFRRRNITMDEDGNYRFGWSIIVAPGVEEKYAALTRTLDRKAFHEIMALLRARRGG